MNRAKSCFHAQPLPARVGLTRPQLVRLFMAVIWGIGAIPVGAAPPADGLSPPMLAHIEFSKDGKRILVESSQTSYTSGVSGSHYLCLYEVATGKRLAAAPGASYLACRTSTMHPRHAYLLLTKNRAADLKDPAEELVLWDWKIDKEVRKFAPATDHVATVAFSPDGKHAFSSHWDNRILVWDVAAGRQVGAFDLPRKENYFCTAHIATFFFPGDGKHVVTGFSDSIRVWDSATGKEIGPEFADYDKAQKVSRHFLYTCSEDGRYACTALAYKDRNNPRLRIWDLSNGRLLREINLPNDDLSYIRGASFADGGRFLLAVADAGWLHAWEVATGRHLWARRLLEGSGVSTATFSPDGRFLLTNGEGQTMRLWQALERKPLWSTGIPGAESRCPSAESK